MAADEAGALGSRIDALLEGMQDLSDPDVAARVEELIAAIVEFYGAGLERFVRVLSARPDGAERLRELTEDDLVAHLLLLHDLHPDDVDTRIQGALETVRPYLGSHAGGVEYLGVADGVAQLRLRGNCDGCPSSTVTVQLAIEKAVLEAAPELTEVAVEGVVQDERPLLQIQPFRGAAERAAGTLGSERVDDGWRRLTVTADSGQLQRVEVAGMSLVVCNLHGTPYAYRDACSACGSTLHDGQLDGDALPCPGCGAVYDARLAGRGISDPSVSLDPLPMRPAGAAWQVAVPGAAAV